MEVTRNIQPKSGVKKRKWNEKNWRCFLLLLWLFLVLSEELSVGWLVWLVWLLASERERSYPLATRLPLSASFRRRIETKRKGKKQQRKETNNNTRNSEYIYWTRRFPERTASFEWKIKKTQGSGAFGRSVARSLDGNGGRVREKKRRNEGRTCVTERIDLFFTRLHNISSKFYDHDMALIGNARAIHNSTTIVTVTVKPTSSLMATDSKKTKKKSRWILTNP